MGLLAMLTKMGLLLQSTLRSFSLLAEDVSIVGIDLVCVFEAGKSDI